MQSWKPALGRQGNALKAVLIDKTFRQSVRDEIAEPSNFCLINGESDKVHVVECALPEHAALEQRTGADIAKEQAATRWT